jgi:hypothetical protein
MIENIDSKIDDLQNWSREQLCAEWEGLYKSKPTNRTGKVMMIWAIAFRWQELAYGGLGSADQKLLDGLAKAYKKNPSFLTKSLQMKQGTRLRRLWNGKVYEVTAEREGFSYDGKRYRSLSEIARLITNTRWNGRVFFGLKSAPKTGKTAGGADVQASA